MKSETDILRQAERKYHDYLRSLVTGEEFFPLPLILGKGRRASEYGERRDELASLRDAVAKHGFHVEWQEVADRRFGKHNRPASASFLNEKSFVAALGKSAEVSAFKSEVARVVSRIPELKPWLAANVRVVLRELGNWERLLNVVLWLKANPCSGLYLRQLPINGVDTKFIEPRMGLLDALVAHPDVPSTGVGFRMRHGLLEEEHLVRLRFLDDTLRQSCELPALAQQLALPIFQANKLPLGNVTAVIVENLRNLLALPPIAGCVALFGAGDALSNWKRVDWLRTCRCFYWGDLDAHGFAMLSRLREFLPEVSSLMMDRSNFERHRSLAVVDETRSPAIGGQRLTSEEIATLDLLVSERLRLEQERIPMGDVWSAIAEAGMEIKAQHGSHG